MSLGVRHLWRFWRRASLAPRVSSWIPRGHLFTVRGSPASHVAAISFSSSRPSSVKTANMSSTDAQDSNGEAAAKSSTSAENKGIADRLADSGSERALNGSNTFIERLSKLPIRGHEAFLPVTVGTLDYYPHARERRLSRIKRRKALLQQVHHTKRHRLKHANKPCDWRGILKTLLDTTPQYSPVVGTAQVIIPEDLIPRLTAHSANSIWEIQSRTGCGMHLHEKKPDDAEDSTYLLLSGETSAIGRAVRDIMELGHRIKVVPLSQNDAKSLLREASPILWERESVIRHRYFLDRPLDEIEKPEKWTPDNFERYITALVKSRLPAGRAFELGRGTPHFRSVVRALFTAFRDPTARPALSTASFKHALRYLVSHGTGLWDHSLELFNMMKSLGFDIDVEVYDIMSLAAVKVNNVGFFQHFVTEMARNGHHPSLQTWMNFLRLIKVEEIRRYIMHAVASKGLFSHPSAIHYGATELVENDVHRAIKLGFDVKSFIASQDALYGPHWLHHQTSNKILDILGSWGKFDEINEFLTVMFRSDAARPKDEIALNIILTHCRNQRKIDAAIYFVKRFEDELGVLKADGITYHLLSDLAWRTKKPHMFAMIWRYSCLVMLTPRRVKLRIAQLLASPGPPVRSRWFTARLKIAGVLSHPPDGKSDDNCAERMRDSDRRLLLEMENLLLCDYKRAHELMEGKLLTTEEIRFALLEWCPKALRQRRPVDKLGYVLALALEEDRKNREDSHAGQEINLKPLPLRMVPKTGNKTRGRDVSL